MSVRTIIEINHDWLTELVQAGYLTEKLADMLRSGSGNIGVDFLGLRIVVQRHHSEEITVKFK